MTTFLAVAFALTVALLLTIWLGPHIAYWLLVWYTNRTYKAIQKLQKQREENAAEMRKALDELTQYVNRDEAGR